MNDYRRMLEEGHANVDAFQGQRRTSRLEYLGDHIFDFTTYDGQMAELFAAKALEVCAAISDKTTYEYIKDAEQYRWYLVMVNMPFFADKLEWGTSIRGAWWDAPIDGKIKFESCGLFLDGRQLQDPMEFTREQWEDFIAALRAFAS